MGLYPCFFFKEKCSGLELNDFTPHMTHVKPIPMVIIALYLSEVQFGGVIIPLMLVNT